MVVNRKVDVSSLIAYLRGMVEDYKISAERYGEDHSETFRAYNDMLVCMEMVECVSGCSLTVTDDGDVVIL